MSINSLPALYWYLLNWINTILVFRYYSQIVKCATFLKSLNARSACKRKITPICIFTKFMATLLPSDSVKLHLFFLTVKGAKQASAFMKVSPYFFLPLSVSLFFRALHSFFLFFSPFLPPSLFFFFSRLEPPFHLHKQGAEGESR